MTVSNSRASIGKKPGSNKPTNPPKKKWQKKRHGKGYIRVKAGEKKEQSEIPDDGLNAQVRRLKKIGAYHSSDSRYWH